MFEAVQNGLWFTLGLGLDAKEISVGQMMLRAAVVYVVTLAMVRIAKKRFMGRATAFDVILGIMLGSLVSRAVTGNAPFLPTLAAGAVLLALHWVFSALAVRSHRFGFLVKGQPDTLIRDGIVEADALRTAHMTEHDLWQDLRAKSVSDLKQVAEARLERGGELSVIKAKSPPKVVEVRVAESVQTVRIEIST